jgi:Zn-dependent metalloprotease
MLESITRNGTREQRVAASRTLATDTTIRALRAKNESDITLEARRRRVTGLRPLKQRTIYTAQNSQILPGFIARSEGQPATNDDAVDEAYDGLGHTFDFFWENYQRNSIDDEGFHLNSTVHYGDKYNNAFWNGEWMVFGDGDGELFNRFTNSIDIIAHELGHGITAHETGLVYMFEPGALNEHLSDVWGSLVKQWVLGQNADEADWLIGAGLFTNKVDGIALRSMKAPGTAFDDKILGKDPQPDHMDDYAGTWEDNGGVHINSGIPNKAFYLAATAIGGHTWEKAGRIWYESARDPRVVKDTKFSQFATITIDIAKKLPGITQQEAKAVADSWAQVGIVLPA